MSDIFSEIDEDLRADRARRLLQRYGGVIIAAAVLVVVAVCGWEAWKWFQARESARIAQAYVAAQTIANGPAGAGRQDAMAGFAAVAGDSSVGYRTLARLRAAALKADAGDRPGALALWDAVAADSAADPLLRDLANLQWALHQIDAGDAAQISARLTALARADNAWHALADEGLALLAMRQGQNDTAREILKRLSQDVTTPDGVRGRANGLLARLG